MKLRFLFRSLYVSKENECFDKFTTFPDGSDLYLSAFVIVRCSVKVFTLFLVRNSVPLTDWCWFQYGLLRRRPPGCILARDVLPYLGCSCVSRSFWFCFSNLIWFLRSSVSLSLSVDVCFVVEGTLVSDFPRRCCAWAGCSNFNLFTPPSLFRSSLLIKIPQVIQDWWAV